MKKITLIVLPNQNPVTSSEIAKLKRGIKKQLSAPVQFNVIANDAAEELNIYSDDIAVKGDYIIVGTDDTNNKVNARVIGTTIPGTSDFGMRL